MTETEARELFLAALAEIAPEAEGAPLDGASDLTEQLDLDSMDMLNVVTLVAERTGRDIPERDYPRLRTLDGAVAYLTAG